MILYKFHIPIYSIDVILVQLEKGDSDKDIARILGWIKCDKKDVEDVCKALQDGCMNGGDTWRNFSARRMLVSFYPMENELKRAEVYSHEKRHIEDRVLEYASIDDIESAGYLAGFIGVQFYEFQNKVKEKLK